MPITSSNDIHQHQIITNDLFQTLCYPAGGKDQKKDPAYGADVLRLWVASSDYSSDVMVSMIAACPFVPSNVFRAHAYF